MSTLHTVIQSLLRSGLGLVMGLSLLFSSAAGAETVTYTLLADADHNPATGCVVETAAGPLAGVDQRWVATVALGKGETSASVREVQQQPCAKGTFSAATWSEAGDWPVGLGQGADGAATVEFDLPRTPWAGFKPDAVRWAVISAAGEERDALGVTRTATQAAPAPIPFLSPPLLLVLTLALAGAAGYRLRRRGGIALLAVLAVVLAGAGLAGGPGFQRDGQSADWAGLTPLATNPAGRVSGPAELRALFVQADETALHVRLDVGIGSKRPPTDNQPPQVTAGTPQTITLPVNQVTLSGTVTDDGLPNPPSAVKMQWSPVSGPGTVAFANPASARTTATFSAAGAYVLRLSASDGALTASADVSITVKSGGGSNQAPQVNAGTAQTITLPAIANLVGTVTDDGLPKPPGAVTVAWTKVSGPGTVTFGNANTQATTATFSAAGAYVLRLTASDGALTASAEVTITAQAGGSNQAPQVNAGTPQTITLPVNQVMLSGTVTDDGLPNPPGAVTVAWTMVSGAGTVTFGTASAKTTTATFSAAGVYVLRLTASDSALTTSADVSITVNPGGGSNQAPQVNAGTPQTITLPVNQVMLSGTVTDDGLPNPPGAVTVAWTMVSGAGTVTFGTASAKTTTATFSAVGAYVLRLSASDGALSASATVAVTVKPSGGSNQAPQVNAGLDATVTFPAAATLTGVVTDDGLPNPPGAVTVIWSQVSGPGTATFANPANASTTATFSVAGVYGLRFTANDGQLTASDEVQITVNPGSGGGGTVPPDPGTTAPPVDPTVTTTMGAATEFLYTGNNPIQTGVAPGTINPVRTAVLRGRVLDKSNAPLSGVTMTILNHPEFGQTLSRADGRFDLAVNGGGLLTVVYARGGYLPAQRQVNAPWQDFVVVEDAILVPRDSQVTPITTAAATMQVAQGSAVTDQSGTRQPALLLPAGTTASKMMPDGSTQPLSTLSLRLSEYTVGANGPKTMPSPLPANVGYTYALELSADEATTKLNGKDVIFNQPVPFYVDNFLNFPVGGDVPVGYYDGTKGAWIPSDNGRIIKVLSISNGMADLDVSGSGTPANVAALTALGITDEERAKIATLYPAGKSVWRVRLTHLSTWDCNWPYGPPQDAKPPEQETKNEDEDNPDDCPPGMCCPQGQSTASGSVIGCESQTLGERIPLVGTGLELHYRSDRVPGNLSARTLKIPLSDATIPASLKRIEASVVVAGRSIDLGTFPAQANQTMTFTWDGKNAYGQAVQGTQPATVKIGYVYDGVYQSAVRFGQSSGVAITGNRTRQEVTLWRTFETRVGVPDFKQAEVAGWSLDVHHVYDPLGKTLYQGDGSRRSAQNQWDEIITTIAGNGTPGYSGDGGPATQASLDFPAGVAVAADSSVLIADSHNYRIRRVGLDGIITTVAGNGTPGYSGDGGPATQASLDFPAGVAVAADSSVLIADSHNYRIRRVGLDGIITTVAGNGTHGYSGDGGPATQASLDFPVGVAVAADGSVLIANYDSNRVRRVGPDGIITTVAGNGTPGYSGDGGPATQASLNFPTSVAVAADGSVLIADANNSRIRRVGPDGIITTVAGNGTHGYSGDGGPATQASLSSPWGVAVTADGSVLITGYYDPTRRVGPDGIITTVAGSTWGWGYSGDGGPATQAGLKSSIGVAVAADGSVLIADDSDARIRKISHPLPGFTAGDIAIASTDGRQLYRFNSVGRHLSTVDTLTGATLYTFAYDSAGRLITITDAAMPP
ncbi:MAG: PKD domain-containing protein [Candidatus Competibacteraceae bacterium]